MMNIETFAMIAAISMALFAIVYGAYEIMQDSK